MTPGVLRSKGFRDAFLVTLVIWFGFVYGAYAVAELIAGRIHFLHDVALDIPAVFLVAVVAQTLYPLAVYGAGRSPAFRWSSVFAAAVVVAVAQSTINMFENRVLGVIPALDAAHAELIRYRFSRYFLSHLYLTFANGAVFVFLVETRRNAEQRLRLAETQVLAESARNAALRLQLNPHFLFNTLNSISSLVVTGRNADAEEMLALLADFLRLSLKADPSAMTPLAEEYATIEAYLEIEAVRFGDRMAVDLDCPAELADLAVPSFILQPLVENALKYGVARSSTTVTVRVAAVRRGDRLLLSVVNDGASAAIAEATGGLGIGLENIRARLANRYGDRADLNLARGRDTFAASISLPLDDPASPPGMQTATGRLDA